MSNYRSRTLVEYDRDRRFPFFAHIRHLRIHFADVFSVVFPDAQNVHAPFYSRVKQRRYDGTIQNAAVLRSNFLSHGVSIWKSHVHFSSVRFNSFVVFVVFSLVFFCFFQAEVEFDRVSHVRAVFEHPRPHFQFDHRRVFRPLSREPSQHAFPRSEETHHARAFFVQSTARVVELPSLVDGHEQRVLRNFVQILHAIVRRAKQKTTTTTIITLTLTFKRLRSFLRRSHHDVNVVVYVVQKRAAETV